MCIYIYILPLQCLHDSYGSQSLFESLLYLKSKIKFDLSCWFSVWWVSRSISNPRWSLMKRWPQQQYYCSKVYLENGWYLVLHWQLLAPRSSSNSDALLAGRHIEARNIFWKWFEMCLHICSSFMCPKMHINIFAIVFSNIWQRQKIADLPRI